MNAILSAKIQSFFLQRGALSTRELVRDLQVDASTINRTLTGLGSNRIVRMGRGRQTRYGLRRQIGGESSWPLYEVLADGQVARMGMLNAMVARQWSVSLDTSWPLLTGRDFTVGLYPDLPWFLDDLRPQGFLGRSFAREVGPYLGIGEDPRTWRSDDVLLALLRHGQDLPGAFIVGGEALAAMQRRQLAPVECVNPGSRTSAYPELADAVMSGAWPGSSAAGEQPKFTACIRKGESDYRHVIVKFCGKGGRREDQRWSDLLMAEHLAGRVLDRHGFDSADTEIVDAGGRRFLEACRFDRIGAFGRRALLSLHAIDSAYFGQLDSPWPRAGERLHALGWISASDLRQMGVLWWFGTMIGNTDMHYGNVSLFLHERSRLVLAPCYDMLPMLYRPDPEGGLPERRFSPLPPTPEAQPYWILACNMARHFWSDVAGSEKISGEFREIARSNSRVVQDYIRTFSMGMAGEQSP